MEISDWFTIIILASAFLGFLIQNEFRIFLAKLYSIEKVIVFILVVIGIPIFIFYHNISEKFQFLNKPPFIYENGLEPKSIAFLLIPLLLVYILIRLYIVKPTMKINPKIITNYIALLEQNQPVFWDVFNKYESPACLEKNWMQYADLVFHPLFLESSLFFSKAKYFLRITKFKEFNERKISIYVQLVNDSQIEKFIKLYKVFESSNNVTENWETYSFLFLDDRLLKLVIGKHPDLLYPIWSNFKKEFNFGILFTGFLNNQNSVYYTELANNFSSYSLNKDQTFLKIVIKDNIKQSMHNRILMVLTDHVSKHLQSEYGTNSIYNQDYYESKNKEKEGLDLLINYHIQFIGFMYSSAIEERIDISSLSSRYTNLQSIYSCMVGQMINNILLKEGNSSNNLTNYHWLIGEIFIIQSNWLATFGDEEDEGVRYFVENSSYVSYIPFSMALCMSELYKGLKCNKITLKFLNEKIYYDILIHYFHNGLHTTMKASIENKIIEMIPDEFLEDILDFALNVKFSINFNDFISEKFELLDESSKKTLLRLLKFLKDREKI